MDWASWDAVKGFDLMGGLAGQVHKMGIESEIENIFLSDLTFELLNRMRIINPNLAPKMV